MGAKKKTKYNIELPIPQEVNDSNQVTWGDDKMNALELAALAVAQKAMKNGEFRVNARISTSNKSIFIRC